MSVQKTSGFSLRSLFARYIQHRREVRAVRQLLELPDSLLRDIGLTRFDVVAAATASGRQSPAKILSSAASENRRYLPANDASSASVVARTVLAA